MRRLRPFFSFFGSKWRIARKYPAPRYGKIIGAFAGSAGYETLYAAADVRLVEIDPVIYGVWAYLIRARRSEILSLPLLGEGETVESLSRIPQEARSLIGFWLNKGTTHPCSTPSAWMREPRYASQFWGAQIRERIAAQVDAISHWRIQMASYDSAPNIPGTWFVDSPYQRAGTAYRFGAPLLDFPALGEWCRERLGQVIVCENEGADWLPFVPLCPAKAMHGKQRSGKSHEVVWYGGRE